VTSSLYDELTVPDDDTVTHMVYDANIVGWYVTTLIFSMSSFVGIKSWFCVCDYFGRNYTELLQV